MRISPLGRRSVTILPSRAISCALVPAERTSCAPLPGFISIACNCVPRGILDKGIALYFAAPASFTGESVLEMHCHGGPTVVAMLVDAAVALGARRAEPGEFSKRAFLNNKLDLVQAEAIADLIGSGSTQAARAALRSLSGNFSASVDTLAEQLTKLRLHVEAAIDFPEEEIDFLSDSQLKQRIEECGAAFDKLIRGFSFLSIFLLQDCTNVG